MKKLLKKKVQHKKAMEKFKAKSEALEKELADLKATH
ncbi:cell division protein FtsB [Wenyingzhuangia aestuarii]|nr:cell division protein FtsB [Wenyingzhuangia aestuarii]